VNTQDTKNLQFQIDALESRLDVHSAQMAALWNVLRSSPEGRHLLLKIQKDAHAILQTMKLEEIYALS